MKNILVNWKTTLAGILSLAVTVLMLTGKLTHDQGASIIAALVSLGLLAAKDGNVHGIGSNATTDPTKP